MKTTSSALHPLPNIRSASRMGCTCWGDKELSIDSLEECGKLGFGWVRCSRQMQLDVVADGPGRYDWARGGERSIDLAIANGMSVMGILDGRWGNETGVNKLPWCSPIWEHLDDWCVFVAAAVHHYRGRVSHWEVINEPPFFWWRPPQEGQMFPDLNAPLKRAPLKAYADLLKATAKTIRSCDPGATIVAGSGFGDGHFLEKLYELGCRDSFDVASVHYLQCHHPEVFARSYRKLRSVMAEHGDAHKPLWDTESGPGGAIIGQAVESTQEYEALYNVYRHCLAYEFGLDRYFWFDPVHWNTEGGNGLSVKDKSGAFTPPFLAMRVLIDQLGEGSLLGSDHPGGEVHLYVFEGPRGPVSVVWSTAKTTARLCGSAAAVDLYGKPCRFSDTFALGEKPFYFEGDLRAQGFETQIQGKRQAVKQCFESKRSTPDVPVLSSVRVAEPLGLQGSRWNQIPLLAGRDPLPVGDVADHFCVLPTGIPGEMRLAHDDAFLYIHCRLLDDRLDPLRPSGLIQFTLRDSNPDVSEWPYFFNGYALFNLHISKHGNRFLRFEHLYPDQYASGVVPDVAVASRVEDGSLIVTAAIPWKEIGPCRPGKNNPFFAMVCLLRCDAVLELPNGDDPADWVHNFVDPFICRAPSLKCWIEVV